MVSPMLMGGTPRWMITPDSSYPMAALRDIARELGIEGCDRLHKGELYGAIEWTHPERLE